MSILEEKQYFSNGNVHIISYTKNGQDYNENAPAFIQYYPNGVVEFKFWKISDMQYHNENGPAYQSFYSNGNVKREKWYCNGKLTRKYGPADIQYFENGKPQLEVWYENFTAYRSRSYSETGELISDCVIENLF